jgi:hypothetical protein
MEMETGIDVSDGEDISLRVSNLYNIMLATRINITKIELFK